MIQDAKVGAAAFFSTVASTTHLFLGDTVEPLLRALVMVFQIGVAGATIFYIITKIINLRKGRKDDEN